MIQGIFDSHAHYSDERFDDDREELLLSMKEKGVYNIMNIGADIESSKKSIELAQKYDFIYCAVGIHPEEANRLPDNYIDSIRELAKYEKVRAIGEIGLDYHYEGYNPENQRELFEKQLILAEELNLPVIIHSRDAQAETMEILKRHKVRGVIHCYSGSAELAKEYVKMGFYIGFTGVLTFKNARRAVESVSAIPLDRLLIETDCPYMAPEPYRGRRCDSSMLSSVANKMAEIKGVTPEEIIDITNKNTKAIFNI